jgi:hypothetical protein
MRLMVDARMTAPPGLTQPVHSLTAPWDKPADILPCAAQTTALARSCSQQVSPEAESRDPAARLAGHRIGVRFPGLRAGHTIGCPPDFAGRECFAGRDAVPPERGCRGHAMAIGYHVRFNTQPPQPATLFPAADSAARKGRQERPLHETRRATARAATECCQRALMRPDGARLLLPLPSALGHSGNVLLAVSRPEWRCPVSHPLRR